MDTEEIVESIKQIVDQKRSVRAITFKRERGRV